MERPNLKQSASRFAFAPLLMEKDEEESSEGRIDPLGNEMAQ
jgi:hypothetical protein